MPLALVKSHDHIHYVLQDTPNVIEHAQKVTTHLVLIGRALTRKDSIGQSITPQL